MSASTLKIPEKNLKDFTLEELKSLVDSLGEAPYRAGQLYLWLFKKGAMSIDGMTDVSKKFRGALKDLGYYTGGPDVIEKRISRDASVKLLLGLGNGERVESVVIPEGKRLTLCVSTQTGCALGCRFCRTGNIGPGRNLKLSELTGQVHAAEALVRDGLFEGFKKITNIVLMGMGEPLLNYDEVVRFLKVLTDYKGMGFSARKVTLSTSGIVPAIKKLGGATDVNLAVSLNATTDAQRSLLMPVNKRYPLKELLSALRQYPLSKKRYITIEYVLIKDINDSKDDAKRLALLLRGIPCKINLIPFNPFPGSGFERPGSERVSAFQKILMEGHYTSVIRAGRGSDIEAACGQLRGARL